ncbi:hypothetical protein AA100600_3055 [Gluconobacter thailandicus F149-1 = NBRC 100600]|nr:hypothetical protein AA100600_3055 [Gluconobacter thailandicus F149-1 = NBRC 100600]
MQATRPTHLLQFFLDLANPLGKHPPICLHLGFTRAAKEAKATTLTLKMGPQADKT